MTKPLRIAVLLDHIESDYHSEIITGVLRATRPDRVKTLIVPGGWLGGTGKDAITRNFIYELLPKAGLDGIVILGGSLSNYCGLPKFREWLRRFEPTPCVVIGTDLMDVCSVQVDNAVGMHALVSHLIERHARRRLAFISGPAQSPEATQRKAAYIQALRDHDLSIDERRILPGGFGREDGASAVTTLLDERRFSPATVDAIVAVNDDSALGALDELHRRAIDVPDTFSVVGFDDAASARSANPPLSTVDQRVELQGFTAARALIDALQGKQALATSTLASQPVLRSSCGCVVQFENDSRVVRPAPVSLARSCRLALVERHGAITAELARAAEGRLVGMRGWEGRLLEALTHDLSTPSGHGFVAQWERLVRKHVALGRDVMTCHHVLTTLRLQALACASLEPEIRPRIEDLFQESRVTLARVGAEVERERQHTSNLRMRFVTKACLAMIEGGTVAQLAAVLDEHLPELGIAAFMVTQLREGAPDELDVLVRHAARVGTTPKPQLPIQDLGLDSVLEQEDAMVIEPLAFGARPIGIAALAWGATNPVHYEQLRELLSGALRAKGVH